MKKCPSCNKEVDDNVDLCPYCGYNFLSDQPTTINFSDIYFPELDIIKEKLANKYKVLGLIGRGGFSTVLKLKDTVLDRTCALKILSRDLISDPEMLERFKREARLYAKLDHPNIVQVYDVGFYKNVAYIIMKYIDGITLKELIKEKAPLELDEIIRISKDISSVLEYMHSRGIIHRDIKPANIMIQKEDGKAILTDFGLAKNLETTKFTATGKIMGSPHYLAPEQAKGEKVDERTDIYSLGITMFEMATGKVPFEGETAVQIVLKHIREELPKPSVFNKNINRELERIILKATKRDPDERYNSIKELKDALERVKEEKEVESKKRKVSHYLFVLFFLVLLSVVIFYKKDTIKNYLKNIKTEKLSQKGIIYKKEKAKKESLEREKRIKNESKKETISYPENKIKQISQESIKNDKNNVSPLKKEAKKGKRSTAQQTSKRKGTVNLFEVSFSSNAKIKLYIDDKFYGEIPPSKKIKLKEGKHKVMYLRETPRGIKSIVKEMLVDKSVKEIKENFNLIAIVKKIVAVPWAKIYIDGKLKDITPVFNIKLKEGTHYITFKHPEYKDYIKKISVSGGETIDKIFVNLNMEAKKIKKSTPKDIKPVLRKIQVKLIYVYPWGNVYIDNKKIGLSPAKNLFIASGKHELKIVHPKFGEIKKEISFNKNIEKITVNFETKTIKVKEE